MVSDVVAAFVGAATSPAAPPTKDQRPGQRLLAEPLTRPFGGGQHWDRASDLFGVKWMGCVPALLPLTPIPSLTCSCCLTRVGSSLCHAVNLRNPR